MILPNGDEIPDRPTDPDALRIWKIKYHAFLYRSPREEWEQSLSALAEVERRMLPWWRRMLLHVPFIPKPQRFTILYGGTPSMSRAFVIPIVVLSAVLLILAIFFGGKKAHAQPNEPILRWYAQSFSRGGEVFHVHRVVDLQLKNVCYRVAGGDFFCLPLR